MATNKNKVQLQETVLDSNGHPLSSTDVNPLTSSDCVIMENGMTLEDVMGNNTVIDTPTIMNEDTSFKVGIGDSETKVINSDVAKMVIEGKTCQNILPNPTTLIMNTDEKEFKINDKIDNSIVLDDNVAEIATIKGQTYVNVVQEESASEYVAIDEELNGQSITTTGKPKGYIKNATLEGSTKYHDIDNDTVLDEFDETKNLELISVNNPKIYATGKNLFDGILAQGYIGDGSGEANTSSAGVYSLNYIKVKPNTTYTRTITGNRPSDFTGRVYFYDINKTYINSYIDGATFTTTENAYYMRFRYYVSSGSIAPSDFSESTIQIEEGSATTSYEPYKGVTIEQSIDSIPLTSDMFEQGGLVSDPLVAGMSLQQVVKGESTNTTRIRSKSLIPVKPNCKYILNGGLTGWGLAYDKNGGYVATINNIETFITASNTYYITPVLRISDNSDITLSTLDSLNLTLQEVTDEIVLRSIGDVKDTLNLTTGEYVQRIGEVVFDGSDDEGWYYTGTDTSDSGTPRFSTKIIDRKYYSNNIIVCDKYKVVSFSNLWNGIEDNCIGAWGGGVDINVRNTQYTSVADFKTSLQQNPITVQYELATPIIHKVNLTNTTKLPSYASTTHYDTIVPSNSLVPNIKIPSTIDYNVAIKPSTQYTIRANTTSAMSVNLGGSEGTLANGKVTLTTPSTLAHNSLKLGNGKAKEVMVVEGSEIKDNVPFFNGMKNVQMGGIKLVNVMRNILTHNEFIIISADKRTITYTDTGYYGNVNFDGSLLKPNTLYTLYFKITQNTSTINMPCGIDIDGNAISPIVGNGGTGTFKVSFTSLDKLTREPRFVFRHTTTGSVIKIQDLMLFEGDWTHLDEIPYIESEMIIEQPIIRSTSEDGVEPFKQHTLSSNRVIGYEEGVHYGGITGIKSFNADFNSVMADVEGLSIAYVTNGSSNFSFWDKDMVFISGKSYLDTSLSSDNKNGFIQVPSNAKYMKFASSIFTSNATYYAKATVTGELPLRSLPNGVCDSFNLVTGEYVQRVGEVVLDGSEVWSFDSVRSYFYVVRTNSNIPYQKPVSVPLCDRLKGVQTLSQSKEIKCGITHIFQISNHDYNNINDFKLWLQQNPITVQYELETPIVRKIGLTAKGNYKEVELNGSENWGRHGNYGTVTRFNVTIPNMVAAEHQHVFSDAFPKGVIGTNDLECINSHGSVNQFQLQIKTSRLTSDSVESLKRWLSLNPVKVGYLSTNSASLYSNIQKPIFFNNVKVQFMNDNVDIQPTLTLQSTSRNSYVMDMMKANTVYTLKALANPNSFTIDGTSYSATTNGTFTSPSTLTNKLLITGEGVYELMIIEGDVTGKTIPYYKGIRSSFDNTDKVEVLIQSTDNRENSTIINMPTQLETVEVVRPILEKGSILKSGGTLVEDDTMRRPKDFIPVQPNTNLTFMNGNAYRAENVIFYDINKNYMGWLYTNGSGDLVVPDNCYFIKFYSGNTNTNDLVLIKKQDKPIALNELPNGVKDELIINRATSSAKLIQRVGKVVLDGSENWQINQYYKKTTQFIVSNFVKAKNATRQEVICDKLQSVTDFYTTVNDSVWIFDSKHLVIHNSSSTSNQLKDWLKQNPITVYYELAEPVITEIRLKGYPFIYEDGSISLNTDIAPVTRTSYNVNQYQLINSQNETIIRHDKQISDLYDYIEIYLDEIYRMELFKMQLELSL